MKKLSKSSPKWLNDALGVNVRNYINNGVELLKMQKVAFSFNTENIASLKLFIGTLFEIANNYKTRVEWDIYLKDKPAHFRENIINITPLHLVDKIAKILNYDKYSSR